MLSDSKEYPPSSLLPTNERSGSAVKCRDANILSRTHKHFLFRSLAYFSRLAHSFCTPAFTPREENLPSAGFRSSAGSCFPTVSAASCLDPSFSSDNEFGILLLLYPDVFCFECVIWPCMCSLLSHIRTQLQVSLERAAGSSEQAKQSINGGGKKHGFKTTYVLRTAFSCPRHKEWHSKGTWGVLSRKPRPLMRGK